MDENTPQPNKKDIKVLRTYTSDMADVIRDNEMSVIKIALAEKEKREQEDIYKKAEGSNFSKIFLVVGGIILIMAGIVGSYFLFLNKKESPQATVESNVDTFISYDSKANIDVTNTVGISDLLSLIEKEQQPSIGLIKALFFTKTINNVSSLISTKDFLSLIETTAPDALTRSLSDKYLFGKYKDQNIINENGKPATFLILETNNYPQAYASMLDWEKTMLKDLSTLFNINISDPNNSLFEKPWKDIIINNKDARVLYGDNGEELLYYVFVNKNDFVITNNLDTLKEVVARLITKNAQP